MYMYNDCITMYMSFCFFFSLSAEHLVSCFSDANYHRINIENGLDVSTRNNQRLLKRVSSLWLCMPLDGF